MEGYVRRGKGLKEIDSKRFGEGEKCREGNLRWDYMGGERIDGLRRGRGRRGQGREKQSIIKFFLYALANFRNSNSP